MIWWWHCFVVTNRGVTSPDPALTSNDKWRFCPTGIKRIKRHVIVLAWLRMQHLGVESWDVGLSSRRFYLSLNSLFSALPHPTPLAENLTRGPAASDDWLHTGQPVENIFVESQRRRFLYERTRLVRARRRMQQRNCWMVVLQPECLDVYPNPCPSTSWDWDNPADQLVGHSFFLSCSKYGTLLTSHFGNMCRFGLICTTSSFSFNSKMKSGHKDSN